MSSGGNAAISVDTAIFTVGTFAQAITPIFRMYPISAR
jgi:hypothetical protein